RTHPMTRDATVEYARQHNLEVPHLKRSTYSTDDNLWGRSIEGGDTEDPAHAPHDDAFRLTVNPLRAPDTPGVFELRFEAGLPVALNGVPLALADLIEALNRAAGAHGIGRIDHVENRLVGIKSREVYEAPAATVILTAKRALEALTLTKEESKLKPYLEQKFSENVYDGLWYAPVMKPIRAALDAIAENVTGTVRLQAYKGQLSILGRTSPVSLFKDNLATYTNADRFDHHASEGFITLWSLPTETANAVRSGATGGVARKAPGAKVGLRERLSVALKADRTAVKAKARKPKRKA
ncbi:MAG TPA: hypothetical protein VI796_07295, partial [Candidatus Thermoplasmatota archaeon]|nr:hypothetical protein [Candidatus Thermoplasmatota archaeon]